MQGVHKGMPVYHACAAHTAQQMKRSWCSATLTQRRPECHVAVRNAAGPSHKWRRPTGLKRPRGSTRPTASAEPAPQAPCHLKLRALGPASSSSWDARAFPPRKRYIPRTQAGGDVEEGEEGEEEEER